MAHVAEMLDQAHEDKVTARLLDTVLEPLPGLCKPQELLESLKLIDRGLRASNLESVADVTMKSFLYQAEIFGLNTARLDIRQESGYHRNVLTELLAQLDICEQFSDKPRAERTAILTTLLDQPNPAISMLKGLSDNAQGNAGSVPDTLPHGRNLWARVARPLHHQHDRGRRRFAHRSAAGQMAQPLSAPQRRA